MNGLRHRIAAICRLALASSGCSSSVEKRAANDCADSLEQIAAALQKYHDKHNSFPPAYTTDGNGVRLHSWRTILLPYMDDKIDVSGINYLQAWDTPENLAVLSTIPNFFSCQSSGRDQIADYVVLVHAETYWHPRLGERTQGNKGIIQVFEITRSDIRWFEPRDVELDEHRHLPEVLKQIARWHDGTSNCIVGTTELTVVTFPDTIDDTNASRLFFRGEPLDLRRAIYHQDADVN